MRTVTLTKQMDSFRASQEHYAGGGNSAATQGTVIPHRFTNTFASSRTTQMSVKICTGDIDPNAYAKIVQSIAKSEGMKVEEITTHVIDQFGIFATNSDLFSKIIATAVGTRNNSIKIANMGKILPSVILEHVKTFAKLSNSPLPSLTGWIITDFLSSALNKLGIILPAEGLIYRVDESFTYPKYNDFLDIMHTHQFRQVLGHIQNVNMTAINASIRADDAVSQSMLVSVLQNAAYEAYSTYHRSFDPDTVLRSVMSAAVAMWNPEIQTEERVDARISNNSAMLRLSNNLSFFLAAQDAISKGVFIPISLDSESFVSQTIPTFTEAMGLSQYKESPLENPISHIGVETVKNTYGDISHVVMYETFSPDKSAQVLSFVKALSNSNAVLLREAIAETQKATSVVSAVMKEFDPIAATKIWLRSLNTLPSEKLVIGGQLRLVISFAFLENFLESNDVSYDTFTRYCSSGTNIEDFDKSVTYICERAAYYMYATLTHLVVADGKTSCSIGKVGGTSLAPQLKLFFKHDTTQKIPLGTSPIVNGVLYSSEPIEAAAYLGEVNPTSVVNIEVLNIDKAGRGLHIWDFFGSTAPLSAETEYRTAFINVRGETRTYSCKLNTASVLTSNVSRNDLRVMVSPISKVMVKMWLNGLQISRSLVKKLSDTPTKFKDDSALNDSLAKTLNITLAVDLYTVLKRIGDSQLAVALKTYVTNSIIAQMSGEKHYDDANQFLELYESHKLTIWTAINLLIMFEFIDVSTAKKLFEFLSDAEVLEHLVLTSI